MQERDGSGRYTWPCLLHAPARASFLRHWTTQHQIIRQKSSQRLCRKSVPDCVDEGRHYAEEDNDDGPKARHHQVVVLEQRPPNPAYLCRQSNTICLGNQKKHTEFM